MAPKIAVVGLAVMGSSLARNIESRGYDVGVYNRTESVTRDFINSFGSGNFSPFFSLEELVSGLSAPRQIILMIQAGRPVDQVLDALIPLLQEGDVVIDGGNAFYRDTERREARCTEAGIHFLGVGISGGEEGALLGPSIMPGGPRKAWEITGDLFQSIAAQADGPCTAYIGPGGSGHFVKMVHNGIEYADMQLIAEVYDVLRKVAAIKPAELAKVFAHWNEGPLASYLMEITASAFEKRDDLTEGFLVDVIVDSAGQKGTGRWTAQEALEYGVSVSTIAAAVDARIISSRRAERSLFQEIFQPGDQAEEEVELESLTEMLGRALYAAKIICYAQGFSLIQTASEENDWNINLAELARIWKGGCIIRARFLDEIVRVYSETGSCENLLLDSQIQAIIQEALPALTELVRLGASVSVPLPGFTASLTYLQALSAKQLPQNLVQAQRDFFGAHTFERTDREGTFHVDWEE